VESKLTKTQQTVVYIGYIILLLSMTFLSKIPGEIGYGIPAVVAAVFLIFGCVSFQELLGNWFSPLMIMMAAVIGVAEAMSASGLTALIGEKIAGVLGASPSPFLLTLVFCLLTSVSATFTGASFGSLFIFAPVGIALCMQYGYSPIALTLACVKAAWINYFMPIDGLPALAMGMGKYKITEFWKYQIPLWIMHILVVAGLSTILFPV
ncbi:MAG: membrane transport protein, partial [Oscillospiraceae bacterium]|nr:membrane transport protein [Oscillospiraceae bacterium]